MVKGGAIDSKSIELLPASSVARIALLPFEVTDRLFNANPTTAIRELSQRYVALGDAVNIASQSLSDAWDENTGTMPKQVSQKLWWYAIRMATRTTPFGAFAAAAGVRFSNGGPGPVFMDASVVFRARPDMRWLSDALAARQAALIEAGSLMVQWNMASFVAGERIYTIRQPSLADTERANDPVVTSIRLVPIIVRLKEHTREPRSVASLVDVCTQEGFTPQLARDLVSLLLRKGFLFDDLVPPLLGNPFGDVVRRYGNSLNDLAQELTKWNDAPCGGVILSSVPRQLINGFRAGLARIHDCAGDSIHVDAVARDPVELPPRIVPDILRFAELMHASCKSFSLGDYGRNAVKHFGESGFAIPLSELIDPDHPCGIPQLMSQGVEPRSLQEQLLFDIAAEATRSSTREHLLTDAELDVLRRSHAKSYRSFELGARILSEGRDAINKGDYYIAPARFLSSAQAGASAARFADMLGLEAVNDSYSGTELVFSPLKKRLGNVMLRPPSAGSTIRIGVIDRHGDAELSLGDIIVSFNDSCARLWRRDGAEIYVTHTSMLNIANQAPYVARLIRYLSLDGAPCLTGFDWGGAARLPFLPRLRSGRIILSNARWQLGITGALTDNELISWIQRWKVPELVTFGEEDQAVVIDTTSHVCRSMLIDTVNRKRLKRIVVEEYDADTRASRIVSPGGDTHEIEYVWAFGCAPAAAQKRDVPELHLAVSRPRDVMLPGTGWVAVKIYCRRSSMDRLAYSIVPRLLAVANECGAVCKWFFIRYVDRAPHLRFRVLVPTEFERAVREALLTELGGFLTMQAVDAFETFNYEREAGRYGGSRGLDVVEECFQASSEAAVQYFKKVRGVAATPHDTLMGFNDTFGIDALPSHDLDAFVEAVSRHKEPLDNVQRDEVKALVRHIGSGTARDVHPAVRNLMDIAQQGLLSRPIVSILSDLLHMHCNRMGQDAIGERIVRRYAFHAYRSLRHSKPANPLPESTLRQPL